MKLGSLLPLIILVVLFYVLVLRPAQRRQRQAQQTSSALEPGLEVMTTAGMLATVHSVSDKHVELEIAPGVIVRFVKAAIAKVIPPPQEDDHLTSTEDATGLPDSSTEGDAPTNSSGG